jgi:ankyrin repeat protein
MNEQTVRAESLLHSAAFDGHVEVVATLLQQGRTYTPSPPVEANTPLHLAGTTAIVTLLLEAGAELHRRKHDGRTPLFQAIRLGLASAVLALVLPGAPAPTLQGPTTARAVLVGAVTDDEEAMTELIAASGELTRRMNENGQLARSAVQLAELHALSAARGARRTDVAQALNTVS